MRILVTGASGLLGAHVMAALARQHTVVGVDRHPWWGDTPVELVTGDLASPAFLESIIRDSEPEVVVHCAAMVDVDACERHPTTAFECNTEMTRRILSAAPPAGLFVYITTDGIFSGEMPLVSEEEEPAPRTVYGRSKLQGEEEVRSATANHLIIRTNFYGWSSGRKATSAEWLYQALVSGTPITAFDDFYFTPIYVVDLVQRLEGLMESLHRGVFHVCGAERVSKFDFVQRMAASASLSSASISRGSIDAARLVAPRPKDMSLSSARAERALGWAMPDCDSGIGLFLADRLVPLSRRMRRGINGVEGE
jgi:dTDP-4-dehydrorhamnose reductase